MFIDEEAAKAALIADGIISPQMLQGMEDAALLQEAVGNHYDMIELDKGKKEDRGKFKLVRKDIRGGTNLPQTVDAILMAAQAERMGEPVVGPASQHHIHVLCVWQANAFLPQREQVF